MNNALNVTAAVDRHLKSCARHYRFLLVFMREWTHDTVLAGSASPDSLPFCTRADAEEWVRAINEKSARGKIGYRVPSHVVVDAKLGVR